MFNRYHSYNDDMIGENTQFFETQTEKEFGDKEIQFLQSIISSLERAERDLLHYISDLCPKIVSK